MDKARQQELADLALERALRKVIRAYDLVSDEADILDWLSAYQGICVEIMRGAFDSIREAIRGEAQKRTEAVLQQEAVAMGVRDEAALGTSPSAQNPRRQEGPVQKAPHPVEEE